ncbi:hypothetical protein D11S_2300 (plasmid) [Aggregatibacter actinomycetemcomitans D11S-1]|uniref:hypothetical protein n=1 Tax=Aggregatibacter actinomycetemcomitans TaxID=714 RepID=UPI0001BA153C|nr:hypothetical protein [Aggregatibacter actinomycetemcomitans]ACX80373.1 hypothetical protein D11S_2300 [Aggregatibacter actinomycetemcomitans D11S-1]
MKIIELEDHGQDLIRLYVNDDNTLIDDPRNSVFIGATLLKAKVGEPPKLQMVRFDEKERQLVLSELSLKYKVIKVKNIH